MTATPPRPRPKAWRPSPFLLASGALHLTGVAWAAVRPSILPWVAAGLAANHLTAVGAGLWPRSRLLGPNLRRLPEDGAAGRVALTFDDGPDPKVTPQVLDLLDRTEAKATFFVIGQLVERHPGLTAEIHARGHRLGNHTFRHLKRFSILGPGRTGEEIDRSQEALAQITGYRPVHFRPPAGLRSPWLEPLLARRGLRLVSWTRRGYDTVRQDSESITGDLLRDLAEGDILLLHDGRSEGPWHRRPPVLDVLPRLLEVLQRKGLRSVALPAAGLIGPVTADSMGVQ
ncbi:MAG: polysaccharide deacetylase family protein [Acidobacteriota bacterium]